MGEVKKKAKSETQKQEEFIPEAEKSQPQETEAGNGSFQAEEAPIPVETVTLPVEEYENLKQELEKSRSEASEYFDGWQRERADFSNYKKRIERDQSLIYQNAAAEIIKRYLPILDDLDRALKTRPKSEDGAAWAEGIELIYRKFLNILAADGVTPMQADGEIFDPSRHEAISHEDSPDHQSGQIIEVVRQGYMQGDRVLRPALVRVAK